MILIEAINISSGGGVNLLIALINKLNQKGTPFIIIHNKKAVLPPLQTKNSFIVESTSFVDRAKTVKNAIKKFSPKAILTFNFPLPFKTSKDIFVLTDFQNLHLVKNYDSTASPWQDQFQFWLKRFYLKYYYNNSDLYITPTEFINKSFTATYGNKVPCKTLSYFDQLSIDSFREQFIQQGVQKEKEAYIYVSSPSDHKNHESLLNAWDILLEKGFAPSLKLTLPLNDARSEPLLERIKKFNARGGNIINISANGYMDYEEVLRHTYSAGFTIFPSLNETFGFGLVEGALMDNKILVSDREFAFKVVKPSLTFEPMEPQSIVDAIIKSFNSDLNPTTLVFKDNSDLLLNILTKIETYQADYI